MAAPYRLGILTTHPIQYQVPLFRRLTADPRVDLTVFFCQIPDDKQQGDGFGVPFKWDVPLLEGYHFQVLRNIARTPSVTSFWGCNTPSILEEIRDGRFDAFLVNGWVAKSCLQALRACRKLGVPCLVRGESNVLRPRARWKHFIHRVLLKQYAGFLAIGSSNEHFYRSHGVRQDRIFPAWYCVENERFASQADDLRDRREELRTRWGIAADATVFLYCGKFIAKKRPLDLLRAAEMAAGRSQGIHLLMVGDGQLRTECERLAQRRRLPVTFTGFLNQTELPGAYVAADCLVLPSDYGETWGLVVNEAMACGLPAIVSDQAGCAADLIIEGRSGAVFPCGDVTALSACLLDMAQDPHRLREMGQQARRHISAYSIDAAAAGVVQAVRAVCGRRVSQPRLDRNAA
jgi:glycosyltransferase involved in cell wall biosynthesis